MSDLWLFAWFLYGYAIVAVFIYVAVDEIRDRWGRVPVIDPVWSVIRDGIDWLLRLPGRVVRWLRPRDTPRGLGGP